ncbi:MAG: HAMP domain-containing histidine kinase [Magnetococcus sp. YQC-3]
MADSPLFDQEEQLLQRYQQALDQLEALREGTLQRADLQALTGPLQEMLQDHKRVLRQSARLVKLGDIQQEKIIKANKALAKSRQLLEQQNMELRAAAELREDVDRIMRHDLKTPLNAIIGFSSLLLESLTDATQVKMCKTLLDSGYTLLSMVNLSLDLYKMERGAYLFRPDVVNILPLLHKIEEANRDLLRSRKLEVTIMLDGRPPESMESFAVLGEELLCFSLLGNLIRNAIEASPRGERVGISLSSGPLAEITIHNQGSVPEAIRERFFEKYVTAGKQSGTGLGTYSARLMAETQNGSMHMETSDEQGTTVTIRMPPA